MRTLRLVLFSLAALAALPDAARAERIPNLSQYDPRPLLRIQAVGTTFAADPFETDVFVYRGGPVFLMHSTELGDEQRTARGVASPEALSQLNQTLSLARVGRQRGQCGEAAPDFVAQYTVTWYGPEQRSKTFVVGGAYQDCPGETRRILDAICAFAWETLGSAIELCAPPAEP
jgi:hypothetical protein